MLTRGHNTQISAVITGIYEHESGWCVRMAVKGAPTHDAADFSYSDRAKATASFTVLNSFDSNEGPFNYELSMVVPANSYRFSVSYKGTVLVKAKPQQVRLLIIQRNLAMVNPEVDLAYHQWIGENPLNIPVPADTSALISLIVPLFNTPEAYLRDMIDSVLAQTYPNWELVMVNASPDNEEMAAVLAEYDDERLVELKLDDNYGIAGNTNQGIKVAKGDYVGFLDHDDTLDPNLLAAYVNEIVAEPQTDLLYCDEDNFYESLSDRYAPRFKPNFNWGLLHSHNYVVHCLMVSRYVLDRVQLSPDYVSGAQDYDMTFKAAEVARHIYHAPWILYHWRNHPGSTNGGAMESKPYAIEAGRRAINDHFERTGRAASAEPSWIPCVYDISYEPEEHLEYEALAFETEVDFQKQLTTLLDTSEKNYFLITTQPVSFNAEEGAQQLVDMLSDASIGVAAPKLYAADGLVEDDGLVFDDLKEAHAFNQHLTAHNGGGYLGIAECICDYSATTAACFALRREGLQRLSLIQETTLGRALVALERELTLQGKRITINPQIDATVLPYARPQVELSTLTETALYNPALEFVSGYARLAAKRDMNVEAAKILNEELTHEKETRWKRLLHRG